MTEAASTTLQISNHKKRSAVAKKSIELGVQLPIPSASSVTYQLLYDAAQKFPEALAEFAMPSDQKMFTKRYDHYLTKFEILRASSSDSISIAKFITDSIQDRFLLVSDKGISSLSESLRKKSPSTLANTPIESSSSKPEEGFPVFINYKGHKYSDHEELIQLVDTLHSQCLINKEAASALKWIINHSFAKSSGFINLKGYKFALLGGTAELSPISALLAAGADVFTTYRGPILDVKRRIDNEIGNFSGRLFYTEIESDLIYSPNDIIGSIIEFSEQKKVCVGAFAYAGGKGLEWRLTAVMDGIIRRLQEENLLGSVAYFLSPSVISHVQEDTVKISQTRYHKKLILNNLIRTISLGNLRTPNIIQYKDRYWTRSFLPYQGCSYAAANLFEKNYAAEVYSINHLVSANTAPITNTKSMQRPEIRAAFREAERFGIEVFDPVDTRSIMQLLMFYDLLSSKVMTGESIFFKQIHGGVFSSPYSLQSSMNEAYAISKIRF